MDDETLDILLEAHAEGVHELNRIQDGIQDVRDAVLELDASLMLLGDQFLATAAAEEVETRAIRQNNDARREAIPLLTGMAEAWGGLMGGIGGFLFQSGPLVDILIVLTLVLAPILPTLVATTVALGAFALGLAAVVSVAALAGAGVIAVGAALIFLAEHAFQAGEIAVNPLAQIETHIKNMITAWERGGATMAAEMISWADNLLPRVQDVGLALERWFGPRLPEFLRVATQAANGFFTLLDSMGRDMGRFIDQVTERMPEFGPIVQNALGFTEQAINGLMQNLLRLADWFQVRLPALGPIAGEVFGGLGDLVQRLFSRLGDLADWTTAHWPQLQEVWRSFWNVVGPILGAFLDGVGKLVQLFVEHWPEIRAHILEVVNTFVLGWNAIAPILQIAWPIALQILQAAIDNVREHHQFWHDAIVAVGGVAALLVITLLTLITILAFVVSGISVAYEWFGKLGSALKSFIDYVETTVLGALGGLAVRVLGIATAIARVVEAVAQARSLSIERGTGTSGGGDPGSPMLTFDWGGTVPGPIGAPRLAVVHGGERVQTIDEQDRRSVGRGGGDVPPLTLDVTALIDKEVLFRIIDQRINATRGRIWR